jgi:hypothetical protein
MITKDSTSNQTITQRRFIFKYLFSIVFILLISWNLHAKAIVVPFEFHNNHIYLKTKVNGQGPFYFLFDSGAGTSGSTIDASLAESLNLPVKGFINSSMIGGSQRIAYTEDVNFSFNGLNFNEKKVAFIPLKEQEKEEGHQIDGLFGYSLIKNYVIEINYRRRIITFHNHEEYKKPKNAEIIRLLDINENKVPVIQGEILTADQRKLDLMITVDTGYDRNFLLGRKFVEENNLQADVISSETASAGKGLGGKTLLRKGKVKALRIGNVESKNPDAIFAFDEEGQFAGESGYIGGKFLKKYKLVLNYKENYLLLW